MLAIVILLTVGVGALVMFCSGRNQGTVEEDHVPPRRAHEHDPTD